MMDVPYPKAVKPKKAALLRLTTRASVRRCTACDLVDGCSGPVPLSVPARLRGAASWDADGELHIHSTAVPSMAVVGEAPGDREDRKGEPFIGKSGKVLRDLMRQVGLDPDDAAYMNAVSCFPNEQRKPRKPTMEEMWKCRGNLLNQIQATRSRYVLLVGAASLSVWRDDLQVTRVHGRVFSWTVGSGGPGQEFVVMPIQHPAAALRKQAAGIKNEIREDLRLWYGVVAEELSPAMALDNRCAHCGSMAVELDSDHVGYCETHLEKNRGQDEWNLDKWKEGHPPPPKRPSTTRANKGVRGQKGAGGQDPGLPGI